MTIGLASGISAQVIVNANFEGGSNANGPVGWNLVDPGYAFPSCDTIWPFQTCNGWELIAPTGTGNSSATCLKLDQDWATQAQGVWQETTAVFAPNSTYIFQLMAKKDFDPPGSYLVMEIGYLGGGSAFISLTGSVFVDYVLDAPAAWTPYVVPYATGSSGPEIGKNVVVLATNTTYRSGLCIDDVGLVVPSKVMISEKGDSTSVSEIGPTSDTYTVVLGLQPTANVTITVDPDAQVEVYNTGAGNAIPLTFTTGTWNTPQTVTVTAIVDEVTEGYHSSTIVHTATSGDPGFNNTAVENLQVIVYEQPFVGHGVFHDMNYNIPEFDISDPADPHHSLWENVPGTNYITGMTHPAVSENGDIYILHHRNGLPGDDLPRNRLKRSTDGGYNWTELDYSQISWTGLNTILVGKTHGQEKLFNTGLSKYSSDATVSWSPFTYENGIDPYLSLYGEPPTHLITLPGTDTFFLTTDQINNWPRIGAMLSTDGGLNWTHGGNLPGHPSMDQFQLPVTIISPDQQQLLVLAGTHGRYSADGMYRLSHIWQTLDDQLTIWSAPQTASSAVAGDRAFAEYARDGRLVLGFRDTTTKFVDGVVWVGTYDDLIHGRDGQYRIFCVEREIDWYGGMVVHRRTPPTPDEYLLFVHNEMVRFTLEAFDALYPGSCKIHLTLDETTGNIASDSFMASKTGPIVFGSVSGAGWTEDARFGGSLSFDGVDDYVSVDPGAWNGLDIGGGSATVSFWLKTSDTNQLATLVAKGAHDLPASGWTFFMHKGTLYFRVTDTTGTRATVRAVLPSDGGWHNATGVVDRTAQTLSLYLDRLLVCDSSIVGLGTVSSADDLELARSSNVTNYFAGKLDNVRTFDYALSQNERDRYSGINLDRADNLLKNGDFEAGTDFTTLEGYPEYWTHIGDNPSWYFKKPPGTGNTSSTCLDLFAGATGYPTGAGFSQETDSVFVPNANYQFKIDMLLTETPSTLTEMWIGYSDGSGAFQSLVYAANTVPNSTVWTTYSLNYATGASGAAIGQNIVVRFKNVNHREKLHCDNAVLHGPGIGINETDHSTDVTEDGAVSDTYTVILNSQPQSTVTVTVDPDTQCQVNAVGAGNTVNLIFTTGSWNAPQTITVSAVNDTASEEHHSSNITHTATGPDNAYNGMSQDIVVNIIDDEPYCGQSGTTYLTGDINRDCDINYLDFYEVACNLSLAYDLDDLSDTALNWLQCTNLGNCGI